MKLVFICLCFVALSCGIVALSQDAPGTECSLHQELLFQMTIDSRSVGMHPTPVGSFAIFPIKKKALVRLHMGFDVRWVDIRPLSAGVQPTISPNHRDVTFTISNDRPLTIEFNDDLSHVVHLFPYLPAQNAPVGPSRNLRYFGPGLHDVGVMELKGGEAVYLAPGAWVKGAIRARAARNVRIFGFGVLDASGITSGAAAYGGRSPIYLERTQNARIEGITIINSHDWTVHIRQSEGTRIRSIKILNPGAWNGDDGIDLDSSSHVLVEDVFVRTNDDCVAIKNLADVDTSDITVRHSVFWNMPNGGNGVEIGFETRSHRIHDIHFQDIDMIHIERGSAISIHNGDSAPVENIDYNDIRVEDVRRKLIDFAVVYAPYGHDRPASETEIRERMDRGGAWDAALCYRADEKNVLFRNRGTIRNIRVTRLRVTGGALPYSVLAGFDHDHGVSDIILDDIEYQGRRLSNPAELKLVQNNASGISLQ